MACPRVAGGGEGLWIWRVDANILNSRGQPTRGGHAAWGLGGVPTAHRKKKACFEMLHRASNLSGHKQQKMDMKFGTWNIRISIGQVLLKTV
jgi:hypothetical protein